MNIPNISNNANNQDINQQTMNNNIPNQSMNYGQPINNGMMNQQPKKNNNLIIIFIIAIIAGVVAYFLTSTILSDDKKDNTNKNEMQENTTEEEKEENTTNPKPETSNILKEFNQYQNYKFTMDMTLGYMDENISTSSNGIADVKNKTDYMVTSVSYDNYTEKTYSYSDYNSGKVYSSTDQKTWTVDKTEGTESINLDDIINKINTKDNDVTTIGDNHYSVKVDFDSQDMKYEGVYADVYVTNGYITKLSYDLTSIVAGTGYSKFTIDIRLSDFNEAGDVVIPTNVLNSNTNSI